MPTEEKEDFNEFVYDPNPHFYDPESGRVASGGHRAAMGCKSCEDDEKSSENFDKFEKYKNFEKDDFEAYHGLKDSLDDDRDDCEVYSDDDVDKRYISKDFHKEFEEKKFEGEFEKSSSSNFTLIDRSAAPPYHPSFYKNNDLKVIIEENRQLRFLMSDYLKEIDQIRFSYTKIKKKYSKLKSHTKNLNFQIEDLKELVQILSQNTSSPHKIRQKIKGKRYRSQESLIKKSSSNLQKNQTFLGSNQAKMASYTLGGSSHDETSPIVKKRTIFSLKNSRKNLKVSFKDRLKMIRQHQDSVRSSLNLKITNNFLTLPQNNNMKIQGKIQNNRNVNKNKNRKPKLIFQKKNLKTQKILDKFEKKTFLNKISIENFLSKNTRINGLRSSLGFVKNRSKNRSIFQSLGNEAMFKNMKEKSKKIGKSDSKKFHKKKKLMNKFLKYQENHQK